MASPARDEVEGWKRSTWGRLPTWSKWVLGIGAAILLVALGASLNSSEVDELKAERDEAKAALSRAEVGREEAEASAEAARDRKEEAGDLSVRLEELEEEVARADSQPESAPAAPAAVQEEQTASEPPNVVGLPLPEAKHRLRQAGYRTAANNTDTTFGIIVPENYTICSQGPPRGDLVVVLAQKYGC
jgi:hypothetical protein